MNLVTGATSEQDLSDSCTEFGTTNSRFGGRPYRYNYAATNEPGWFLLNGLVKHDVGRGPIAHARLPERIASGTHSCWAPGESLRGW